MTPTHPRTHTHAHGMTGRKLRTAFVLTLLILLVEVVGGIASHSLALLSDAGHVLTDIVALGLAWFATVRAEKPADARNTYGYHRTGILAALANAITLILIVVWIAYEAVQRLQHPQAVTPWIMFAAAAVGIAVNLYIGLGLRAEGGENLNARGAMLHALGDVGASAGVIVGGLVILLTGWVYADPLISLGIALLIARSAWGLLGEAVDILMEATPRDLDVPHLVQDVVALPGVEEVHDLHIWSLAGGMRLLTAHVRVGDNRPLAGCDRLVDRIHCLVCERYGIGHTTLQLERVGCAQRALYCSPAEHQHNGVNEAVNDGVTTQDAVPGPPRSHDHPPDGLEAHS
jgi:cobalt-zinc-cadmium efflux system protein